MAVLAERAHHNNLGIGHPAAPEPIHEDDPSWMAERSKGQGGQGTGGTRRLVLVLHGLEGSSTAPLTKRFSSVFTRNGCEQPMVSSSSWLCCNRDFFRLKCCCCCCSLVARGLGQRVAAGGSSVCQVGAMNFAFFVALRTCGLPVDLGGRLLSVGLQKAFCFRSCLRGHRESTTRRVSLCTLTMNPS